MTSKPSLFTKMRDALVAVGRSERTATRKARRLEAAPFADFVRLTPEQNVKLGLSREGAPLRPEGRQARDQGDAYDKRPPVRDEKGARAVRPHTRAGDGSASPWRNSLRVRRPTRARRQGGNHSRGDEESSRRSRSSAPPASMFRAIRRTSDATGSWYPISADAERRYRGIRRHKLAGEHIPDGEWHWFIDYARRFKDPRYELLRGSPAAFGFSLAV